MFGMSTHARYCSLGICDIKVLKTKFLVYRGSTNKEAVLFDSQTYQCLAVCGPFNYGLWFVLQDENETDDTIRILHSMHSSRVSVVTKKFVLGLGSVFQAVRQDFPLLAAGYNLSLDILS